MPLGIRPIQYFYFSFAFITNKLFILYTDPFTCYEIKIQHPNVPSGIFRIDPAGPLDDTVPSFEVYCDFSSNVNGKILCVSRNT